MILEDLLLRVALSLVLGRPCLASYQVQTHTAVHFEDGSVLVPPDPLQYWAYGNVNTTIVDRHSSLNLAPILNIFFLG